ncbi:MAG: DinB family protein [Flavobacteriaceae bacterium]|nr:DinB family protein [Flavobacteriaceae bacterium]
MEKQFEILRQNRMAILKIMEAFSLNQLNKIPSGFKNNIAWNVAHLLVTQQLLCYALAELPMHLSEELIARYRKGTAPQQPMTQEELDLVKSLFVFLIDRFENDYQEGKFKKFSSYTTSTSIVLNSIEDALTFNNYHEGIHTGSILALSKLV